VLRYSTDAEPVAGKPLVLEYAASDDEPPPVASCVTVPLLAL
jgi:hypothetical protein